MVSGTRSPIQLWAKTICWWSMGSATIPGRTRTSKVNKMPIIKNTQNMLKNASGILKQVGEPFNNKKLSSYIHMLVQNCV